MKEDGEEECDEKEISFSRCLEVLHKEVEADHSDDHEKGIVTPVLGEGDMVSHEGERETARQGNAGGELSSKKVDHKDTKSAKDQWNDSKVSFRFGEGIELMGNHEKKRSLEISWIIFIKLDLAFDIIS